MLNRHSDSIDLAEHLMRLGWWDEAASALNNPDVSPSDKLLESCSLWCRRDCVQYLIAAYPDHRRAASMFDRYTLQWTYTQYKGAGSELWQKNAKVNDLTDLSK